MNETQTIEQHELAPHISPSTTEQKPTLASQLRKGLSLRRLTEHSGQHERKIHRAEVALGLNTDYDRQAEASLFIDKKFLSYALITGVTTKPERIFSDSAWADYLDGRLFAREYGAQDLTPEFILDVHKKLTHKSNPTVSGKVRETGVIGASYDDEGKPASYTPEQMRAIEDNPRLSFRRVPPDDESSTSGFIVYPYQASGTETRDAVTKDLAELCEWFNNAKSQDQFNPHIVAGLLQHRLVSLHPFLDGNGTLSRVLMNWSLENDGEAPSVIDNPGADIFTDEETWISFITEGSKQFKKIKQRQSALEEAGIDNVNALFDLGQDKAFYDYIFRHLHQAPPLPTNGEKHNHQTYEQFLADFKTEMDRFQEYMRSTSQLDIAGNAREITQGGLITPEFMQFATSPNAQVLPLELKQQLFTDTEAYRGGMVDGEVDDEKICQMFGNYTGVGTGYRPLQRSHLPATSLQTVNQDEIQESLEYYNHLFASAYFAKKHPDVHNPYEDTPTPVRDLNATVREHIGGGKSIWNSPFASTSLNYGLSKEWAKKFYAEYAKNAKHGVLFRTQLPREGMVMTFGQKPEALTASGYTHEYEALVAGGLQPASITGIEVYDKENPHGTPGLYARRVVEEGKVNVVIEDRHGEFIVQRTYTYSPDDDNFALTATVATEIPSTTPIDQPPAFAPQIEKQAISGIIFEGHSKGYNSPFKNEKNTIPITHNIITKTENNPIISSSKLKENKHQQIFTSQGNLEPLGNSGSIYINEEKQHKKGHEITPKITNNNEYIIPKNEKKYPKY